MSTSSPDRHGAASGHQPVQISEIDFILTAQIAIAWAGESGEEPRLSWWRTDLVSEFGGEDLFKRLLPHSWRWAVLQGVREAARRHDANLRAKDHNPDRLLSLFNLGFELDERVEERLQDLKRAGGAPTEALPGLAEVLEPDWSQSSFTEWAKAQAHAKADYTAAPVGRRINNAPPSSPETMVSQLVTALLPLGDEYPLPHFRRDV